MTTGQTRGHQVTNPYFLSRGAHPSGDDGRCAMEWVAYLAGESHSDQPVCVSPVLKAFCIGFNDALDDKQRQKLRPYLARTIGTAGDGLDGQRALMCLDWIIRTYTPTWLSLGGLANDAKALRDLPEIVDVKTARRAAPILRGARERAADARDAALPAALAAARVAALAAARDAALPAARVAALAAALADARVAAWVAAWDAAWDAALDAAWDAARVAALVAAWDAALVAALAPTVVGLQTSAFALLDRMLPKVPVDMPAERIRLLLDTHVGGQ